MVNPLLSQICLLVKHTVLKTLKVMVIEVDPWLQHGDVRSPVFQAFLLDKSVIRPVLNVNFQKLRKAELLFARRDNNASAISILLLQFDKNILAINLVSASSSSEKGMSLDSHQSQDLQSVFQENEDSMLPRYMIRSEGSSEHVFCAASQGSTHKVVKIEINTDNPGQVQTKDIFVLGSALIVGLESDPQDPDCIYVIDDFQTVLKLSESKEGKAVVHQRLSLAQHSLEDELREIQSKPWVQIPISDRVIIINNYCLSTKSSLYWKQDDFFDSYRVEEIIA